MTETYAVASSKGGVGKTTTVANLGTALADAGRDVVVVDADIGMANLAGALGIDITGATLHDALAGEAGVLDAVYEGPNGLAVVPGSPELDDYRDAKPAGLADLVADLEAEFETVILDTGAGLSHDTVLPLGLADEVILVSTSQRDALNNTDKTRKLVERLDGSVTGLVLTRAPEDASSGPVEATVLGRIPDDPTVDDSLVAGEPVVAYRPHSPAARAYRAVTETTFGVEVPDPEGEPDAARDAGIGAGGAPDVDSETAEGESEADTSEAAEPEDDADEADADERGADDDESESGDAPVDTTAAGDAAAADEDVAATADAEDAEDPDESADDEAATEADADSAPEDAAAPRKSVGPVRETDVPISEAEGGGMSEPEPRRAEDAQGESGEESDEAVESEESTESKGFFARLFGR